MKIGDLVEYHGQLFIVIGLENKSDFIRVKSITTGYTSSFPPDWLTKVETDNFCPLHSSSDLL